MCSSPGHISDQSIFRHKFVTNSSDSSAALCQIGKTGQNALNAFDAKLDLLGVAAELLAQGKWGSILSVRSANLDNVVEGFLLLTQSSRELGKSGQQALVNFDNSRHVHGSREAVGRQLNS